jgi:hypothetical protein
VRAGRRQGEGWLLRGVRTGTAEEEPQSNRARAIIVDALRAEQRSETARLLERTGNCWLLGGRVLEC